MQAPQLRARLDPDRLDQRAPNVAIRVQRLDLPPRAVQRKHPLHMQALTHRLPGHQRIELANDLPVPAGREVLVERQFQRGQAELLQAADLRRRERLVGDIGQRAATPQRQCLARQPAGDQPLEAARVQPVAPEP